MGYSEERATEHLKGDEVRLRADVGVGTGRARRLIPAQNIVAWGNVVPWTDPRQVEQDLVILPTEGGRTGS